MSDYNKFYKANKYNRGYEPNELVKDILKYKNQGKVLDLGCGEGQDIIFLAEKGFETIGIDLSNQAIDNLIKLANKRNVEVDARVMNITEYNFSEKFDVILSEASLHFLKEEEREDYIHKIKNSTNKNGINVLGVFDEGTSDELYEGMTHWGISLFRHNELFEYYSDWEILSKKSFEAAMDNGYKRGISQVIARKINEE